MCLFFQFLNVANLQTLCRRLNCLYLVSNRIIYHRVELEDSPTDILRPRDPLDIGSADDDDVGEKLLQPIVHCIFSARFDEADGPCIEWYVVF